MDTNLCSHKNVKLKIAWKLTLKITLILISQVLGEKNVMLSQNDEKMLKTISYYLKKKSNIEQLLYCLLKTGYCVKINDCRFFKITGEPFENSEYVEVGAYMYPAKMLQQ